jgi:hypothetical protein
MNPTLLTLIVALICGVVTDAAITKLFKASTLGTILGLGVFVVVAAVGLGVA